MSLKSTKILVPRAFLFLPLFFLLCASISVLFVLPASDQLAASEKNKDPTHGLKQPSQSTTSSEIDSRLMMNSYKKVVLETGKETATVIWLHGLGDTPAGWLDVAKSLKKKLPYIKWILPEAKNQPVTVNRGFSSTSWFDLQEIPVRHLPNPSPDNGVGQKESIDLIKQLVKDEMTAGRNADRIVVGGFSQGAALALAATLQVNLEANQGSANEASAGAQEVPSGVQDSKRGGKLAGCVVFSGWALPSQNLSTVVEQLRATAASATTSKSAPGQQVEATSMSASTVSDQCKGSTEQSLAGVETAFLVAHGRVDDVVLAENAKHVETLLKQLYPITSATTRGTSKAQFQVKYYDMPHSSCPEELNDLFTFLQSTLPAR